MPILWLVHIPPIAEDAEPVEPCHLVSQLVPLRLDFLLLLLDYPIHIRLVCGVDGELLQLDAQGELLLHVLEDLLRDGLRLDLHDVLESEVNTLNVDLEVIDDSSNYLLHEASGTIGLLEEGLLLDVLLELLEDVLVHGLELLDLSLL